MAVPERPAWWLDEVAHAGREHLDRGFVAGYDQKSQVDPTPDIDKLVGHGMGTGSRVLDLGAGTGVFSAAATAVGADVVAVDISPAMCEAIRDRGVAHVVQAGMLSYEPDVGEPAFDVVYCRNVLHQVPDAWKAIALNRIFGWLRPGGVLRLRDLVYDVEPDQLVGVLDAWMARGAPDPTRGYTAADFEEHVRTEHSTFTWLLEPMLTHVGFEIVDREVHAAIYAAYTCVRPPIT